MTLSRRALLKRGSGVLLLTTASGAGTPASASDLGLQSQQSVQDRSQVRRVVRGDSASPGRVQGRVQQVTIHDNSPGYAPRDAVSGLSAVGPGDIAFMPDLYPCMVDELRPAAGLVIYEERCITGRGSVVAREFDVPAVIDCDAVASAQTGNRAVVWGTRGIVQTQITHNPHDS